MRGVCASFPSMVLCVLVDHNITLQWRHNEPDGVSNHQPYGCLHKRLFRCRSKKTPKLRVNGLCAGNSPVTGEFLAQRASNAENVLIWWRHHHQYVTVLHKKMHMQCRIGSHEEVQKTTSLIYCSVNDFQPILDRYSGPTLSLDKQNLIQWFCSH